MINRRAVSILLVDREDFRDAVRRPRTALIGTVLTNQKLSGQRMIIGRKTDRITVPMPPPGSSRVLRADAELGPPVLTGTESLLTHRWRKTDSNSRSLREGTGYGEPLQGSIAVSNLNLKVALPFVPPPPIGNVQKSLSQERDRWFESGSLQERVMRTRDLKADRGLIKPIAAAASRVNREKRLTSLV